MILEFLNTTIGIFLAGILDVFIGIFVLIKNFNSAKNRAFFLFTLAIGIWSLSIASFLLTNNKNIALFLIHIVTLSQITISCSYLYLCIVFSKQNILHHSSRNNLILILLIVLAFLALFIPHFYIQNVIFHSWGKESILGIGYYLLSFLYGIIVFLAFYKLFLSFSNPEFTKKDILLNKYLFWGMLFSISFGSIFDWLLPLLNYYEFIWVGPYSLFVVIGSMGYAIIKRDLLDITVIIKKGSSFFILAIFILITFVLINYYSKGHFIITTVLTSSSGIFWAFVTYPLSDKLITRAKRKFIKGYYDPDLLFKKISDHLAEEKGREKIFESIEADLDDALELEKIGFICAVKDTDSNLLRFLHYEKESPKSHFYQTKEITVDHPLVIHFSTIKDHQFYRELPDKIQEACQEFDWHKSSVLIPFHSPESLEGILILGERSGGIGYKASDYLVFKRLINTVNAVLYRLTPYDKLEKTFFQTQQKLYETQIQLARTLKHEELLHAVGQCHHEIKTPLSIISFAANELPDDPGTVLKIKNEIIEECTRGIDYVNEALAISDGITPEGDHWEMVDVNEALSRCFRLLPQEKYEIETHLGELPKIKAVFNGLQIVFTNLVNNAREAMMDGGKMVFRTGVEDDHIIISISDTGVGIAPEHQESVWTPYLSGELTSAGNLSKGKSKAGRGWGLSIVNRIIKRHSGQIRLESELNKGTTFFITLPIQTTIKG